MSKGRDHASGTVPNWMVLSLVICLGTATLSFARETTRVSVDSLGNQGNSLSGDQTISADGRFVAFASWASNLVAGDTNSNGDVFVHDRQTGETTRVSVDSLGNQGNFGSVSPAISADGRFVAFDSVASNLVAGDTNVGEWDVFVHDRQTGATTRVSVDSLGNQGNHASLFSAISADGRVVAFGSDASNLVVGDTNGDWDVFVHDRQTGETTRVSVDSLGNQGNSLSGFSVPGISADGRFVAFESLASNLVAGDTNGTNDVFVHDRQTGETTRVSVDSLGNQGTSSSLAARVAISADGRVVAFQSWATNLVTGDTNSNPDVFVHDRQTGETTRVSVDSVGNQGTGESGIPAISADGRVVAFESSATNLVAGDTNGDWDVFVHDQQTGETTRVSVDSLGNQGNSWSGAPAISADGRVVAFGSLASNLVVGDTNGTDDVFVHDRQTVSDTDGDGIPDDSDPDVLSAFLETLPDEAFKSHSGGLRTAMQSLLDNVERAILSGDLRGAIQKLRNLRRHVDGCGATAGSNDWVTHCPSQIEVREMLDSLIANLGG